VQKLVALYGKAEVAVTASNNTVHKPSERDWGKYVLFTARAGVSAAELEALQKAFADTAWDQQLTGMRDCMGVLGPGLPATLETLAKEAENWQVQWQLRPQNSPHVQIKLGGTHPADDENVFDFPGQMQSKLERVSPSSAETELRLAILPERERDHPGALRSAPVEVCALVETAGRPSIGLLVDAAGGGLGLASSLVDLMAGWGQTMLPPSSCTTLEVTYHEQSRGYRFENLKVRFDDEILVNGQWMHTSYQEIILSGQTCGEDAFGQSWGLDLIMRIVGDYGGPPGDVRSVGADLGTKRAWCMGITPDGHFIDRQHYLQSRMIAGGGRRPGMGIRFGVLRLRLLPQSPLEVELTAVPLPPDVSPGGTRAQQDGQTVRAPVEEIMDCELDPKAHQEMSLNLPPLW
jgi:hypothetical protein